MNENINLCEILKDCPEGTEFWSDNYGKVRFMCIDKSWDSPIFLRRTDGCRACYTKEGLCSIDFPASCLLWPSKDCRDWSKFSAPWHKKERFDPKTLQPFDKVLVKGCVSNTWKCGLFSHVKDDASLYKYSCAGDAYAVCIPYNEDTKHLVGTKDEAPEYYRYWED